MHKVTRRTSVLLALALTACNREPAPPSPFTPRLDGIYRADNSDDLFRFFPGGGVRFAASDQGPERGMLLTSEEGMRPMGAYAEHEDGVLIAIHSNKYWGNVAAHGQFRDGVLWLRVDASPDSYEDAFRFVAVDSGE